MYREFRGQALYSLPFWVVDKAESSASMTGSEGVGTVLIQYMRENDSMVVKCGP